MGVFNRRRTAKEIAADHGLRNALWLVKNGIPFDIAFELYPEEVFAWSVIFSEFNGAKFDWDMMQFEDKSS